MIEAALALPVGAGFVELRCVARAVLHEAALEPYAHPSQMIIALGYHLAEEYDPPNGELASVERDTICYLWDPARENTDLHALFGIATAALREVGIPLLFSTIVRLAGMLACPELEGTSEHDELAQQRHVPRWFLLAFQAYRRRRSPTYAPASGDSGTYASLPERLNSREIK